MDRSGAGTGVELFGDRESEKYAGEYAPQLYDTRKDPQELKNVAEQRPAVVKDLHAKLERYVALGWEIRGGSFAEKVGRNS